MRDALGRAARLAEKRQVSLTEAPPECLDGLPDGFERDVHQVINLKEALRRRNSAGEIATVAIRSQLEALKKALGTPSRIGEISASVPNGTIES